MSVTAQTQFTLPAAHYTSGEVFEEELTRIFYERWLCCGRAERIAGPGSYVMQEIGSESAIVLRDRGGAIKAFHNVCRHRGTRLCDDAHGQLSGSIQCPYHAWTYGLDGQLIGAPHMEEVEGFQKADYPLRTVAIEEWEGFLYVNFSRQPEPFETAYAPLMDKFKAWRLADLRAAGERVYDVACNWKLVFLNYSECYHCPKIHPALAALQPYRANHNDLEEGPFLGGASELNEEAGSLSLSGAACAAPIRGVAGQDLSRVYYYTLFPNVLLSLHPDYVMAHTIWPEAPDRTRIVCQWLFEPETMAKPGFDPSPAIEFWDMTNRQDWHVSELTQRGMRSRAYAPGPYSTLETMLAAWDREYLRVMERV